MIHFLALLNVAQAWDFPCEVPQDLPSITIAGETHVAHTLNKPEDENPTVRLRRTLFERAQKGEHALLAESFFENEQSSPTFKTMVLGAFHQNPDAQLRAIVRGLEDETRTLAGHYAYWTALWSSETFSSDLTAETRAYFLQERAGYLNSMLVQLISDKPGPRAAWKRLKNKSYGNAAVILEVADLYLAVDLVKLLEKYGERLQTAPQSVDDPAYKKLWALGSDGEMTRKMTEALESPDFGRLLGDWGIELVKDLKGSQREKDGKEVGIDWDAVVKVFETGEVPKNPDLHGLLNIEWRNIQWVRAIGRAYCELKRPLAIVMGRNHLGDLETRLKKATDNKVPIVVIKADSEQK